MTLLDNKPQRECGIAISGQFLLQNIDSSFLIVDVSSLGLEEASNR